jgi:uncharacterized protein HemX
MSLPVVLLLAVSVFEVLLLAVLVAFFFRLKRSEALLSAMQERQTTLLAKLRFNEELERELVATFERRQSELASLEQALSARAQELGKLLTQAERAVRSPRLLREIVVEGRRAGKTPRELASSTGLSIEEVELLLEEAS